MLTEEEPYSTEESVDKETNVPVSEASNTGITSSAVASDQNLMMPRSEVVDPGEAIQQENDRSPSSSLENIIPMSNLRNGWSMLSSMIVTTADMLKVKSLEAYNCESAQLIRQQTSDGLNHAISVVVPVVTSTVETTKERINFAIANAEPALRTVGEKAVVNLSLLSQHIVTASDFASQVATESMSSIDVIISGIAGAGSNVFVEPTENNLNNTVNNTSDNTSSSMVAISDDSPMESFQSDAPLEESRSNAAEDVKDTVTDLN